jgi:hypothetical protein
MASNLRGLLSDGSADQSNDCILERRKKHGPSIADDNNIDEHQSERLFWRSIQLHFRQGISRPALRLMMLWTAPPPARECQGCGRRLRLPAMALQMLREYLRR